MRTNRRQWSYLLFVIWSSLALSGGNFSSVEKRFGGFLWVKSFHGVTCMFSRFVLTASFEVGPRTSSMFYFLSNLTDIREHCGSSFSAGMNIRSLLYFASNLTDVGEYRCIKLDGRAWEGRAFIEEGSLPVWTLKIVLRTVVG